MLGKKFDMKELDYTKKILDVEIHRDRSVIRLWPL